MHVSANDCTYPGIENQWHGNEWKMDTCTWVQMIVHISVFFFSPHVVFPFYKLFRLAKCCWIFDPIAVFPVNCCRYFKSICCLLTVLFASQSWEPESWADMKIRDPQHLTPKMFYNLGTLGCTKTYENNALQPSHLTGRSHWDTFPLFFGSCGKRRHRWCCTEPPCQQSMASHASPLPLQEEQVVHVVPHQHQHCHTPRLPSFCFPSSCLVPFLRFDQGLSDNMTGLKFTRDPLMNNQSTISWDHPWPSPR